VRPANPVKEVFLVDKEGCRGKAVSVWGIQKGLELDARQASLKILCHQLRHTMATRPSMPMPHRIRLFNTFVDALA
jgi:hypothetical protein